MRGRPSLKLQPFVTAARLPFIAASILPAVTGILWGAVNNIPFYSTQALVAISGMVAVHLGANTVNDYLDGIEVTR